MVSVSVSVSSPPRRRRLSLLYPSRRLSLLFFLGAAANTYATRRHVISNDLDDLSNRPRPAWAAPMAGAKGSPRLAGEPLARSAAVVILPPAVKRVLPVLEPLADQLPCVVRGIV